jgi:hypothetical protein
MRRIYNGCIRRQSAPKEYGKERPVKKKLIILVVALVIAAIVPLHRLKRVDQDTFERDRVVLIHSNAGSCTGVKIQAPSGINYILTAGHCRGLVVDGLVDVKFEDGTEHTVRQVSEDLNSDLLLLEAADKESVSIADKAAIHDKVHTMTHGRGLSAYRTDGELLEEDMVHIPFFPIANDADVNNCQAPKFEIIPQIFFLVCAIHGMQTQSTAWIIPGSSGGPLFNANSELIGIASATSPDRISSWVTLKDIKAFLKDK